MGGVISFRDAAWVCRAKHAGRTYVKTICVGRDSYHAITIDAYDALCDWQQHVEAGGDHGAGAIPDEAESSLVNSDEPNADAEADA